MTKRKTKASRIVLIAAILAVAGLGVWYATRAKSSPTAKKTTPTTETKQAASTDTAKTDVTIDKDAPAKTETTSTDSSAKTLYIVVNRPVNNDSVMLADGIALRSTITGTTSGTCTLALVGPGGKTVNRSTSIAAQPSYGSCSFDVAGSELTAGDWNLTLTATSGSSTGKATLKVTVK